MMNYKLFFSLLLIVSVNNMHASFVQCDTMWDSGSDSNDNVQGGECFGGFPGYKQIEQVMADDQITMNSIEKINCTDAKAWDLVSKINEDGLYTQEEKKELTTYFTQQEITCLLDFKELQYHLNTSGHKEYDRKKVVTFIDKHKKTIAAFKKTAANIDLIKNINTIVSIHHSL